MHETGHTKPMHRDNTEGWDGEAGERGVQDGGTQVHPWLIHVNVWQKAPQYCKVISLQLKEIIFFLIELCQQSPHHRVMVPFQGDGEGKGTWHAVHAQPVWFSFPFCSRNGPWDAARQLGLLL